VQRESAAPSGELAQQSGVHADQRVGGTSPEGIRNRPRARRAVGKIDQVTRAAAVRGPESRQRHRPILEREHARGPVVFLVMRRCREPRAAEGHSWSQVVDVPTLHLPTGRVAREPCAKTSRAKGTPQIDVDAGLDIHDTERSHGDSSRAHALQQQSVGTVGVGDTPCASIRRCTRRRRLRGCLQHLFISPRALRDHSVLGALVDERLSARNANQTPTINKPPVSFPAGLVSL